MFSDPCLRSKVKVAKPEREMIMQELQKQIRDLQGELVELQKDQAVLRLQPCRGDSEIRKKDEKIDELDRRGTIIKRTIRDLTRKLQLLISESTKRES
jgi:TolA-binding protein